MPLPQPDNVAPDAAPPGLNARCGAADAERLRATIIGAPADSPLSIDARGVETMGQAAIQVLAAMKQSGRQGSLIVRPTLAAQLADFGVIPLLPPLLIEDPIQ